MKIQHSFKLAIAALCLAALPSTSHALLAPAVALEDSLTEIEREALGTLALADERMRDAILEASLYPRAVERIASISRQSGDRFRDRMNAIPRSKQKEIWELVRYPELIDALVLGGRPSRGAIDDIVAPYPEAIRDIASRSAQHDFNLLNDIAHMRSDAERETGKLIASLPLSAQANFEALIDRPELMTALADNPAVLHRLGSHYRDDSFDTRKAFDRYHEEETLRNEEAIAEWRDAIEDDPEAQAELIESAEEFADEEGYESPRDVGRVVERTEVHHYHHPYPYWFGAPYWYTSHYWYPYRAHWGFAYDVAGAFFVFGLPSPYYSAWHYRAPERRHHYRHLDRHIERHASHQRSYRGSRIRDHASSHKRSDNDSYSRSRDGRRSSRDLPVVDDRNGSRSRSSLRGDDRGGRENRSRMGTRGGERDAQPRKHKSKFREATQRARDRVDGGSSVRSDAGRRSKDRPDAIARRTRDTRKREVVNERRPTREIARGSSHKSDIRSKARRNDSHKIAMRSSGSSSASSAKRTAKDSTRAKVKSPKRAKEGKAKSEKKGGNGGQNFARR